jgi:hypothetical protein
MFSLWPPIAVLALIFAFVLVAMIIAAVSRYELTASLWKIIFKPGSKD